MTKRRDFLFASSALVSTIAAPALAEAATSVASVETTTRTTPAKNETSSQGGRKKFKITFYYIPGLVSVGNVLNGGGADKKEKEVAVIVEADDLGQAKYAIEWNSDGGFVRIMGATEIAAIAMSSVTRYGITSA